VQLPTERAFPQTELESESERERRNCVEEIGHRERQTERKTITFAFAGVAKINSEH